MDHTMCVNYLKIVFFGEDSFSCVVLESLIQSCHKVLCVVTPLYNNNIYKRLELICRNNNIHFIRVININSIDVEIALCHLAPDLFVISHFEKLIHKNLLNIPKLGTINLHPSLLPYYRGMAPQHFPIMNGETITGVSVHYVDEGVDTGNIILQEQINITADMYVSDLQKIWLEIYKYIVIKAIDHIITGMPTTVQINLEGSYYKKLKLSDCNIDISKSVDCVYNLIKGVSLPYYGARYDGKIIYKAHKLIINNLSFQKNGIYYNTEYGHILKLYDGYLKIDLMKEII